VRSSEQSDCRRLCGDVHAWIKLAGAYRKVGIRLRHVCLAPEFGHHSRLLPIDTVLRSNDFVNVRANRNSFQDSRKV
jgi:hypothetical protein